MSEAAECHPEPGAGQDRGPQAQPPPATQSCWQGRATCQLLASKGAAEAPAERCVPVARVPPARTPRPVAAVQWWPEANCHPLAHAPGHRNKHSALHCGLLVLQRATPRPSDASPRNHRSRRPVKY